MIGGGVYTRPGQVLPTPGETMKASRRLSKATLEDDVLHSFDFSLLLCILLYFILILIIFFLLKFSTTSVVF